MDMMYAAGRSPRDDTSTFWERRIMRMGLFLVTIVMATSVFADEHRLFISESEKTVAVGGSPWRVYLDAKGKKALDGDGNGQPDRFSVQYTADQAAKAYLRANGGGEAYTGLGGVVVFRHTVKGRTVFIPDDPEPPIDPDPQPPVERGDRVTIYIDGPGGPSVGDDSRAGRTPETAVATVNQAKKIAYLLRAADPGTVLTFAWRRGDTFTEAFTIMKLIKPSGAEGGLAGGFPDNPTIFTGYGEGAKPRFELGRKQAFGAVVNENDTARHMSHTRFDGLSFVGTRTAIGLLGPSKDIEIRACDFEGTNVTLQARRFGGPADLRLIDTNITNCGNGKSGMFLNGVKGVLLDRVVLYRNGYRTPDGQPLAETPDEDMKVTVLHHGAYITNTCTDVRIVNSFAIFNGGAGLQMRAGGELLDTVVAWNQRTAVDFGWVNGSPPGVGGKTALVARNYIQDDGAAQGLGLENIKGGLVADNILVWRRGWKSPLHLRARWGPNNHKNEVEGGERVGINNLIVERNDVYGNVTVQFNGWGKLGGDGATLRLNRVSGVLNKIDFADPDGKLIFGDDQFNRTLPAINKPIQNANTIQRILNREVRAIDFISEIKGVTR